MDNFLFDGERYNDDRLFVLYIARCTVKEDEQTIETTIYHEDIPDNSIWCVVTCRNVERYRIFRVDHFDTKIDAESYMKSVEPQTPLFSLNANSPRNPLPYEEFVVWKKKNNLEEYDYKKMFDMKGAKPREIAIQEKQIF